MNIGAPWPPSKEDEARVLEIQTKLHHWATDNPNRRFNDLYNLVYDPAFLAVAWKRVRSNRGARTAGVDGQTARYVSVEVGEERFLTDLRAELKARTFHPLPVRQRTIPKPGGKRRSLGIATVRDRVVQAALKLVLEPIFEADFKPCSYGFRPGRRVQDAIAEIHLFCSRSYEWIVEGDITACFDEISHSALLDRLRQRVGDRRILALVKAFLKAGVLGEDGIERDSSTGAPQGGILSPLLSNVALSVLDEHFTQVWGRMGQNSGARQYRRRKGHATYRVVRYADDFVVLVAGTREHAEAVRDEAAAVLAPMGLRLSETKTKIAHIDEGFDFLGFRIRRDRRRGADQRFIYTYPSKTALMTVKGKVRTLTQKTLNLSLTAVLHQLNRVLRGWTNHFRYGVSKATFSYLRAFTWRRVVQWLRHKHLRRNWNWLRRHYLPGWWPAEGQVRLFNPGAVVVTRYRYRGTRIPSPWAALTDGLTGQLSG